MIALEHLADGSVSDRNFQTLARLVLDTGGITAGIRFGADTVTFTASPTSATKTITHGLGRTPTVVLLQEFNAFFRFVPSVLTSTQFTVQGYTTPNVNTTGSNGFYWVVIG